MRPVISVGTTGKALREEWVVAPENRSHPAKDAPVCGFGSRIRGAERRQRLTEDRPPERRPVVGTAQVLLDKPAAVNDLMVHVVLCVRAVDRGAVVDEAGLRHDVERRLLGDAVGEIQILEHGIAPKVGVEPILVEK